MRLNKADSRQLCANTPGHENKEYRYAGNSKHMFVRSNKNKTILDSDIQDELGKLLSASKLHSVQKATLSLISGLATPQPLTVSLWSAPPNAIAPNTTVLPSSSSQRTLGWVTQT